MAVISQAVAAAPIWKQFGILPERQNNLSLVPVARVVVSTLFGTTTTGVGDNLTLTVITTLPGNFYYRLLNYSLAFHDCIGTIADAWAVGLGAQLNIISNEGTTRKVMLESSGPVQYAGSDLNGVTFRLDESALLTAGQIFGWTPADPTGTAPIISCQLGCVTTNIATCPVAVSAHLLVYNVNQEIEHPIFMQGNEFL